jgi:hypothetical protein
MRQVEDHVCPVLTRRVPTICVLLSALFQERISYFTVYMLLLQDTTIAKQNMRIKILESSGLSKPDELIMYKAVLYIIQFVDTIYNSLTCCSYKVPYKNISTDRYTDTNETFRTEGNKEKVVPEVSKRGRYLKDVLRHLKGSLGSDALGEDGGLRDVELQASVLKEHIL